MVSITLSVPKELKQMMESHPEMNWSEIARQAIKERILLLDQFKKFTKNSKLTEKDALNLSRTIKKSVAKRYKK